MAPSFADVAEVRCDPHRTLVYEHGWQSWSPAGLYPATATTPRPRRPEWHVPAFRPDRPLVPEGAQGEGLLALVLDDGTAVGWFAPRPRAEVPTIRTRVGVGHIVVTADGDVDERRSPDGLAALLTGWADEVGRELGVTADRSIAPGWCSWYCYWDKVTEDDVIANLGAIDRLDLPITTVQVDDGHQATVGDWLERSPRFGPLDRLAGRIVDSGRAAGIWTAPFLVGAQSRLAAEHPEWLVKGALASTYHWDQSVYVLDVTHPGAAEHLVEVYRQLARDGFSYHKVDFLYAGAQPGARAADVTALDAYAEGLRLIREGIGDDAVLVGCGAPLLPSIGRVDAMRVSPDVDPRWDPKDGDLSQPGGLSAVLAGRARGWMHGRFWTNDPDCLLVRPDVERREDLAAHVIASGGCVVSSDPLDGLDARGVELLREALQPSRPGPLRWAPELSDPS